MKSTLTSTHNAGNRQFIVSNQHLLLGIMQAIGISYQIIISCPIYGTLTPY
jgi:hypothetical protein